MASSDDSTLTKDEARALLRNAAWPRGEDADQPADELPDEMLNVHRRGSFTGADIRLTDALLDVDNSIEIGWQWSMFDHDLFVRTAEHKWSYEVRAPEGIRAKLRDKVLAETHIETVQVGPDTIPDPVDVDHSMPIDEPLTLDNPMVADIRENLDGLAGAIEQSTLDALAITIAESIRKAVVTQLEDALATSDDALGDLTLMDLTEFRDRGYLFEVNRRFFHPLGMALVVNVDDPDGMGPGHGAKVTHIIGIDDSRDDPDGYYFGDPGPERQDIRDQFVEWAREISNEMNARAFVRTVEVGGLVQPPDKFPEIDEIETKAEPG